MARPADDYRGRRRNMVRPLGNPHRYMRRIVAPPHGRRWAQKALKLAKIDNTTPEKIVADKVKALPWLGHALRLLKGPDYAAT